jgi:hypothetical protein
LVALKASVPSSGQVWWRAQVRARAEARRAASALYHAASAVLLAWEGTRPGADARRALVSRFVLEHRLSPRDPLEPDGAAWEEPAIALLLDDAPVPLTRASALLA